MRPAQRSQFTLGQLMVAVALFAIQAALVNASMSEDGVGRLLALIAAAWFLPFTLMVILTLRVGRESGRGWAARLFAKRCPRCARRTLIVEIPPSLHACDACGVRCQRQRDGHWKILSTAEDRGVWVGPYLKHLRDLRRRMRPTTDPGPWPLPTPDDRSELASLAWGVGEEEPLPSRRGEEAPPPGRAPSVRTGLLALLILAGAIVALYALVIEADRIVSKDAQQLYLLITIALYALYFCLMVGFLATFRWSQILLMLAVTAGLQAALLGAAGGRLPWVAILGSTISIPLTPMLLGYLIARFERTEAGPEDSTCAALLRSQRRLRSSAPATRSGGPLEGSDQGKRF